jgi:hypothetical protein
LWVDNKKIVHRFSALLPFHPPKLPANLGNEIEETALLLVIYKNLLTT